MKIPNFYVNFKVSFYTIKYYFALIVFLSLFKIPIHAQKAEPYEILINEFMPDPAPAIGLPNAEFIELFNRSNKTINLNGFKLINGSVKTILPNFTLKPNNYVIIYTRKTTINFAVFGDTLPVSKLISLSNPGDTFYLESPENLVIDAASFDISLYQNTKKADGGWSLERMNANAPCLTTNWIASNDLKGGTPGQKNSVFINVPDNLPPQIMSSFPANDKKIVVKFDKSLNKGLASQPVHYQLDNNIEVSTVKVVPPMFDIVELTLNKAMQKNTLYQLTLKTTLKDCNNTPLSMTPNLPIQLPERPERNDLIINELLMNPETGGSRFVEIYNRSKKVVDLSELKIADITKGDVKNITTQYALFPEKYVVLTENPLYIQTRYKAEKYKNQIIKNRLPTWNADKGNVTLYTTQGAKTIVIDSFDYDKNFHNPLLANTEGVSLERISPNETTNNASNWHSAAASAAYATPGYQNSQYITRSSMPTSKEIFTLEQKTFSPDEDGFQDYLLLNYEVDKVGYLVNILVFNIEGILVKKLKTNELLSSKGQFKWDGETDENLKAPVGAYIIYIELISPEGSVKKLKMTAVLANKF